jgi:hypothetical protein
MAVHFVLDSDSASSPARVGYCELEVLGMKTIIHVNQHVIKHNRAENKHDPVLTIKTYKSNTYAHEVKIKGESTIVYSPDKPLSCGARVWIETQAEVEVVR